MTAEVAVMNKSAVGLAADSKVSIGAGSPEKTYDTVNRIFALSKVHPVGIMIYGNADFMGFPWETIVKLYRAAKRDRAEATIADWGEDFTRFVRNFPGVRRKDIEQNIYNVLYSMLRRVEDEAIVEAHRQNISLQSAAYEGIFRDRLQNWNQFLSGQGRLMSNAWFNQVVSRFSDVINSTVLEFAPRSNQKLLDEAIEFASRALIANYSSPQSSGYVVAGFGRREIFPALSKYETDGYIGSRIKIIKPERIEITLDNDASISAFAQHDIVRRFMEGIDPEYGNYLRGLFRTGLIDTAVSTFRKHAPQAKQTNRAINAIRRAAEREYNQILRDSLEYRQEEFERPTLEMVALLQKDDVANLAESLVALTALHRRVSRDLETVGGPIDVAIISKGDGFIWVKRKHYFKLELNRHFELNYLREVGG